MGEPVKPSAPSAARRIVPLDTPVSVEGVSGRWNIIDANRMQVATCIALEDAEQIAEALNTSSAPSSARFTPESDIRNATIEECAKVAERVGRPVGAGDGDTYVPGTSGQAASAIRALKRPADPVNNPGDREPAKAAVEMETGADGKVSALWKKPSAAPAEGVALDNVLADLCSEHDRLVAEESKDRPQGLQDDADRREYRGRSGARAARMVQIKLALASRVLATRRGVSATRLAFPQPNEEQAMSGWAMDFDWLTKISKLVQERSGEEFNQESIEAILLASKDVIAADSLPPRVGAGQQGIE